MCFKLLQQFTSFARCDVQAKPDCRLAVGLSQNSLPPRVKASAEVLLSPWAQSQLAVHGGGVSQGQGKWGRATHHLALLIVLGSMARAAELVGSLVPGHDAAKVSAHGQECEVLDVVRSGDEVVRLTLQSLHQLAVVVLVALHPRIKGHRIAINISCKLSTTATTCHRRHEVPEIAAQCHQDWDASGGHQDKVHELSAPYKSTQDTLIGRSSQTHYLIVWGPGCLNNLKLQSTFSNRENQSSQTTSDWIQL